MRRAHDRRRAPERRGARRAGLLTRVAAALCLVSAPACEDGSHGPYLGTTSRTGKDATTFYVNNSEEPQFVDPGKSVDTASTDLLVQMFEGLTAYAPRDLHPVQGVALRWERSDDNRFFRFHLRPEARWSDGKQVTAHDFEYSWKRVLRPATGSLAAANLYVLKNGELFNLAKLKALRVATPLRAAPRPDAPPALSLPAGAFVLLLDDAQAPGTPGAAVTPTDDAFVHVAPYPRLPTYDPAATELAPAAPQSGFVRASELVEDDRAVGVRATDDLTLDVELEQPAPYFTDLTSSPTLLPVRRDVVEPFEQRGEPDLWFRPENIVVNGPYTLEDWKFRYEITMKRNPMYWDRDRLRIHRIVWLEIPQYNATMQLYRAGDLDWIGDNASVPAEQLEWLSTKKDYRRSDYLNTEWYEFNTAKPPVDDVRVRWALNLAVDKQQIVEKITRAGERAATHYVPEFTGSGYAEQAAEDQKNGVDPFSSADVSFNPERARALLAEAGYQVVREGDGYRANGFPPLEILFNTGEGRGQLAVAIQDMWKRHLGVSAALRNEEWRVMLSNMQDGNFQVLRMAWVADFNHPQTWLSTFLSYSPQNRTSWADKEFDQSLRSAAVVADPKESIRHYRAAEKRALDGMCRMPLFFGSKPSLVKPWVKGFIGNSRNMQLMKWFWIDPEWQDNPTNEVAAAPLEFLAPGRLGPPRP